MKIHIDHFHANNPDRTIDDLIFNIQAGVTKEGVVNVHFETTSKYVQIDTSGTHHGPDFSGEMINITPHIYDSTRGGYLEDVDFDAYLNHPEYYHVCLVVDHKDMQGKYFNPTTIALKHEYFVSYVPDHMVMNHNCLEPAEIIEWVEGDD